MDWINGILIGLTAIVSTFTGFIIALTKLKKELDNGVPKILSKQLDLDHEILQRMDELKERLDADRVQFFDFHNGDHYASGRSALKCSCTYEVTRAGITSRQSYLQSIPLSVMPGFVRALLDKKIMDTKVDDMVDSYPATYNLKKNQKIKSFYDIVVNSKDGDPIGYIAIQFLKKEHEPFSEVQKEYVLKFKHFLEDNIDRLIKKERRTRLWNL